MVFERRWEDEEGWWEGGSGWLEPGRVVWVARHEEHAPAWMRRRGGRLKVLGLGWMRGRCALVRAALSRIDGAVVRRGVRG